MGLAVGDRVYIPDRGVGIVRALASDEEGHVEVELADGLTHSVLLSEWGGLGERDPIPANAVPLVLDVLRTREVVANVQPWDQRHREYAHRIRTGDPLQVARVLGELGRLALVRKLSLAEREVHDHALWLIVQEIAYARGIDGRVLETEILAIIAEDAH